MRQWKAAVVGLLVSSAAAWAAGGGAVGEAGAVAEAGAGAGAGAHERYFTFHYDATLTGLPAGKVARVWLPVPPSDEDQTVETVSVPEGATAGVEPKYGNHLIYLERTAGADGSVHLECVYRVRREQVTGGGKERQANAAEAKQFLQPDAKVPVGGKSMTLLAGRTVPQDPLRLGRLLYDVVDDHMTYRKDQPGWGTGDSEWATDSKFGNCTDFHSLFISMARAEGLPAKFEMGFLLGPEAKGQAAKVAGYHCWAKFKPPGERWVPVDISEANQHPKERDLNFGTLTPNRVMFSVGRDLTLSPPQAGGPLNFFVYPYVEVEGAVWPQEKIGKSFSYEDGAGAAVGGAGAPAAQDHAAADGTRGNR